MIYSEFWIHQGKIISIENDTHQTWNVNVFIQTGRTGASFDQQMRPGTTYAPTWPDQDTIKEVTISIHHADSPPYELKAQHGEEIRISRIKKFGRVLHTLHHIHFCHPNRPVLF